MIAAKVSTNSFENSATLRAFAFPLDAAATTKRRDLRRPTFVSDVGARLAVPMPRERGPMFHRGAEGGVVVMTVRQGDGRRNDHVRAAE